MSRWTPKNLPGGGNSRWNQRNAHHILEAKHARAWGLNESDLPAVNLSRRDHDRYHDLLRNEFKTVSRRNQGQPLSKLQVKQVYQRVYQAHPDWLDAIEPFFGN
ncbi:hypothetical protein [Funiculus sociatus]|uniref:hypothetical protein n=1 Tax=Funiculus sociatus TaxID=450527 RepID=UPI0019870159|nr:hypothetical protein [Trichocoleus sp. FACHB-69]